jgi:hypothetical protein
LKLTDFFSDIGRPVAYYPKLTNITGGVKETLFLCQLLYWEGKQQNHDGWIYKTQEDVLEETGLSRREQETARRNLKAKKFISEKCMGIPRKLFYRVNLEAIDEAWDAFVKSQGGENAHSSSIMAVSDIQECPKRADSNGGFVHTNTENTTENTTKKKHMCVYPDEFEEFWKVYPRRIEKKKAFRNWQARIREGYSPSQLIEAAKKYATKCETENTLERYTKHPATFLGPDKPFEEFLKKEEPELDGWLRYIQLQQQALERDGV